MAPAPVVDQLLVGHVLREALEPALKLLPPHMDSTRARVQVLASGAQESRFEHRYQVLDTPGVKGPARGLWQFERGGGVAGICKHRDTHELLRLVCRERDVGFEPAAIWGRLEYDDVLAAACARLLLWADPQPLPQIDDTAGAWECYLRTWRPGQPHPQTWPACHAAAVVAVIPATPMYTEDDL